MQYSFNIDVAAQLINTIVNSFRCSVCDTKSGNRLRFSCGHTICSECADSVTSCLLCLTPPGSPVRPVEDETLSKLAKDSNHLLDAFQDTFHIDVAVQQNICKQRKIEKELFPECIQAPTIAYYNKKKSNNKSPNKSRKSSILPGEIVSLRKMDENSTNNYVQEWLQQHDNEFATCQSPRQPFADLSVNSPNYKSTPLKKNHTLKENTPITKRKRSHNKTTSLKNLSLVKRTPFKSRHAKLEISKISKDESGIVIDDTIVIDDSQSVIDKDQAAWLAVLEEHKKSDHKATTIKKQVVKPIEENSLNVLNWLNSEDATETQNVAQRRSHKIPFYKKSAIANPCQQCRKPKDESTSKNVSIRIETNDLITTVTVTKEATGPPQKVSKNIQTDIQDLKDVSSPDLFTDNKIEVSKEKEEMIIDNKTEDLKKEFNRKIKDVIEQTVISESSDSEYEMSGSILVQAQVHKSSDNVSRSILGELADYQNRSSRARKRSWTSGSSDSSNKENRDPNRKRVRTSKPKKKFRH